MESIPWPLALAFIFAAQFVQYLTLRQKFSGRIDGTEASQLWIEQSGYRRRLEDRIVDLEKDLEEEKLMRQYEGLRSRVTIHDLRNEVMRLQFVTHPDIPDDVKEQMLTRQKVHVTELDKELTAIELVLKEKGFI